MKKVLIVLGVTVGVLFGVYAGFAYYFNSHYLYNTTINNIKCEKKEPSYVISKCDSVADDYLLTIIDRDNNRFHIRGIDIGYKYVPLGEEEAILNSQNSWLWPKSLWQPSRYSLSTSVSYDEDKFQQVFDSLECFSDTFVVKPTNAYIVLTEDDYFVISEVLGNELKPELVSEVVREALITQSPELTLNDDFYKTPEIYLTDPSIINTAETLETYLSSTITYNIGDGKEVFDRKKIMSMISMDSDGNITLDEFVVTKFAQQLASKYNTYADKRQFKTSAGDTITIGGGDYGWVINKSGEAEQILEDLKGGAPVEREPLYSQRAKQSGPNDIGKTYIEIDYTAQHLWYYENGKLKYETDIVSGNVNRQNGSVDGVFKIAYKQRNAVLKGEDYESAVDYFMPFAYNIGIHDASWRKEFGGEIYKESGSHGCINVPHEAAEALFGMVEKGTPVVAYYREDVELTNNAAKQSNAYSYIEPPAEPEN